MKELSDELDEAVQVSSIDFEINRFWSSPEYLRVRNVIGVVLAKPTLNDVMLLCERFGVEVVGHVFEVMTAKGELLEHQIQFVDSFLGIIKSSANGRLEYHDKLSLMFHLAVKREFLANPSRVISIARDNLAKWKKAQNDEAVWMKEWGKILDDGEISILNILEGLDERAIHLRSSSPFPGVISGEERQEIIRMLKRPMAHDYGVNNA